MVDVVRLIIGAFLNIEMWAVLILNVFVLTCIIKGRLHMQKDNCVYILASFNICSDICQLILHVLYIGPAIISGEWFFAGQESLGVTIAAVWFLGVWYLGSLMQILFATNRLAVVFFPSRTFFTRGRVVIFITISCCAAAAMATYSQLLSPCCRITPNPRLYSYSYLIYPNHTENPSMYSVDLPLDTGTSVYCGISYIALFAYVLKVGSHENGCGKREIRCCIQFMLMFLTYTIAWLTFFVYPAIGLQTEEPYVVTTAVYMLDCGINSIIYLILNKEVRAEACRLIGKEPPTSAQHFSHDKSVPSNIPHRPGSSNAVLITHR